MEYNALIREYSGKSLKVLARILVADLKDFPADWKIRYRCKDIDRDTTDVRDLCCSPKNPLQIYKPMKDAFPVTVRTLDGKSFEVICSPTDSVKVLKLKIFQLNDAYPPPAQALHISMRKSNLEMVFDFMKLNRFMGSDGATVYLRIKGKALENAQVGVHFMPINHEITYKRSGDNLQSVKWNTFGAGINFCGNCTNPNCISKEDGVEREVVARPVPFGEFRMKFEGSANPLDCPACSGNAQMKTSEMLVDVDGPEKFQIIPRTFILFNARSLVYFRRAGEEKVWSALYRSVPKSKKQQGGEYKGFEAEGKMDLLEITTVEPWRSPFCCVRCDTGIMFKSHEFHMECGHVYHTWCMPSILKGLKPKCKVCEASVLIVGKMGDVLKVV